MLKKILAPICSLLILSILVPSLMIGTAAAQKADSSVTYETIVDESMKMISSFEGNYGSVNPNDNGALSIGCLQWHAGRALNLCRTIVNANPKKALEILGDALYNEILSSSTVWTNRILVSDKNVSNDESDRISALISTEEGIAAQDYLIKNDVSTYIDRAIGLGITDPIALVYFADVENQCGSGGSKRIAAAAAEIAGSYSKITLSILHEAALADPAAGKYATRRNKAYNHCLLLNWSGFSSSLEVWTLTATRIVRAEPSTSSTLVTTLYKGTNVVVTEKAYFEGLTRAKTSMGWLTLDLASCTLNTELTGAFIPAPVTFKLNGGTFTASPKVTTSVSGLNVSRAPNSLVIYDNNYGSPTTLTNAYGTEIAVDATGLVLSKPTYGTNKTTIPEGGLVISGHGTMTDWMKANITKGNYIYFDRDALCLNVYSTFADYTSATTISAKTTGKNVLRRANDLIIYDENYTYSSTKTNAYGTEVAVDASGRVLNDPKTGTCNTTIPKGGFVLSGHDTMQKWLSSYVKAGYYIKYDAITNTVTVYSTQSLYIAKNMTTAKDLVYGTLPTPHKAHYSFTGWYNEATKEYISKDTICQTPFCVELTATWEALPTGLLRLDTDGGNIKGVISHSVDGINTSRLADQLIIYDQSGTKTPTNEYGTEVAVDSSGNISEVYNLGVCGSTVPEGGYIISGNGSASDWIRKSLKAGMHCVLDRSSMTLTVYESKNLFETVNRSRYEGEAIGALPECEKEYYAFLGWYSPTGEKVTANTIMPIGGTTLKAKWQVLPGALIFDAQGGTTQGELSSYPLSGTNITRGSNKLVLYKNVAYSTENPYGTEALIGPDGTVLFVYPYGACKAEIPAGCSVLSGHGNAGTFVKNLERGQYISIDNGTVTVWNSKDAFDCRESKTVLLGGKFPKLPTPVRAGYTFAGWTDSKGNIITEGSTVSALGDITLKAKWDKKVSVTLDTNGGTIAPFKSAQLNGCNILRKSNALVVYAGVAKSNTNAYGREAAVDKNGKIISVISGGKTAVPDGGFVLSGHGTMADWIKNNIKAGYYVKLQGYKITVYPSEAASQMTSNVLYITPGSTLGALPEVTLNSRALSGWFANGVQYSEKSTITGNITLKAQWTVTSAEVIFDTRGGKFNPMISSATLSAINKSRGSNMLVLYDKGCSSAKTPTNAYGTEIIVDHFGIVTNNPTYGIGKTTIPDQGFVLSAHGNMYDWLKNNVKKGNYIRVDRTHMTVSIWESYSDYLASTGKTIYHGKACGTLPTPEREGYTFVGWMDHMGTTITESTIITDCSNPTLYAKWKKNVTLSFDSNGGSWLKSENTLTGTNISRKSEDLILYKDKTSTGTNAYGTEVLVSASGEVIARNPYGKGNAAIPSGGFVLSGHGANGSWLSTLSVGNYIVIEGKKVLVYENRITYEASVGTVTLLEGEGLSTLPHIQKYGYDFQGWYYGNTLLTPGTPISSSALLIAKWEAKEILVSFDPNGGSFAAPISKTADGINVIRTANTLIIYNGDNGKTSTGTNIHGTEVVVNADGIVIEKRPYGNQNAPIPEGGFVLSGHDTASAFLTNNVFVGSLITLNGLEITIYKNPSLVYVNGKTVTFDSSFGTLPTPEKEGKTFAGWYDESGNPVTPSTILSVDKKTIKLIAKWT